MNIISYFKKINHLYVKILRFQYVLLSVFLLNFSMFNEVLLVNIKIILFVDLIYIFTLNFFFLNLSQINMCINAYFFKEIKIFIRLFYFE